jgi:hypothetical protein
MCEEVLKAEPFDRTPLEQASDQSLQVRSDIHLSWKLNYILSRFNLS